MLEVLRGGASYSGYLIFAGGLLLALMPLWLPRVSAPCLDCLGRDISCADCTKLSRGHRDA